MTQLPPHLLPIPACCRLQSAFAAFLEDKQKMLAKIREQREAAQRRQQAHRDGRLGGGGAGAAAQQSGATTAAAAAAAAARAGAVLRPRQPGRVQQLVSSRPQAPSGKGPIPQSARAGMFGGKAGRLNKRKLAAMVRKRARAGCDACRFCAGCGLAS
jgi:hypothetical protein